MKWLMRVLQWACQHDWRLIPGETTETSAGIVYGEPHFVCNRCGLRDSTFAKHA